MAKVELNKKESFSSPINIYFYDGEHSRESQMKAFTYFHDIFDEVFIVVVDDFASLTIKEATHDVIDELGYQVLYEQEIIPSPQEDPVFCFSDSDGWWNGVYIAVLKKR